MSLTTEATWNVANNPMLKTVVAIVTAAGKLEAFETEEEFHLVIPNGPYMPLVIEAHNGADDFGLGGAKRDIIVTHYFEKEHPTDDAVADTDLKMLANGANVELTYAAGRCYDRVYSREGGKVYVAPRTKREVAGFARMWSRNLRQQGFIKAAKKMAEEAKAQAA